MPCFAIVVGGMSPAWKARLYGQKHNLDKIPVNRVTGVATSCRIYPFLVEKGVMSGCRLRYVDHIKVSIES